MRMVPRTLRVSTDDNPNPPETGGPLERSGARVDAGDTSQQRVTTQTVTDSYVVLDRRIIEPGSTTESSDD